MSQQNQENLIREGQRWYKGENTEEVMVIRFKRNHYVMVHFLIEGKEEAYDAKQLAAKIRKEEWY